MATYQEYKYFIKKYCKEFDIEMDAPCVAIESLGSKVYMASFRDAFVLLNAFAPVKHLHVLNRKQQAISIDPPSLAFLSAEHRTLKGRATHYFVESSELADFCVQATPILNMDILSSIVKDDSGRAVREAVFHTPDEAILFRYFGVEKNFKPYITVSDGVKTGSFYLDRYLYERAKGERVKYMLRLVSGICLYLKCFPDSATDGVPSKATNRLKRHFRRENTVTVQAANEVVDRSTPTPHFRSGHFRLLSSEKFTRKKGQVVFVKGTYVRGKAKTVTDQRG
jgi:hypothetical protein